KIELKDSESKRRIAASSRLWKDLCVFGKMDGDEIDFWDYTDPIERTVEVTLADQGKGDLQIEEKQREDEMRKKVEEAALSETVERKRLPS
ncbi:hypothetical protein HDU96_010074, partial [Phlyctochytrium bullatum]